MTQIIVLFTISAKQAVYRPPGARDRPAPPKLHEYELPSNMKQQQPGPVYGTQNISLMLSIVGKNLSRRHFEIYFFLISPRNSVFLEKNEKKKNLILVC